MRENNTMRRKTIIFNIFFCLMCAVPLQAQTAKVLKEVERADALRESYLFEESLEVYRVAREMFVDSLMTADDSLLKLDISDRMLMSENGVSMASFVSAPVVVARHKFSLDDFFLYYPLPDKSWRIVPDKLDSIPHDVSKALYFDDKSDELYWSMADKNGIRNIYRSEHQDTVWSAPNLLNEHLTSMADEIYPMLSPDGKKLYFSSKGLYGVGGYDLYESEWDEGIQDWSTPVNMGFPYSSPSDDFLFVDSPDGRYSVFASNRDCSKDSVWVYVLEYDDMPVRHTVSDVEELRSLASLVPSSDEDAAGSSVNADIPENVDTRRYMLKMTEVRSLRDSLSALAMKVENARIKYGNETDPAKMSSLENELMEYELLMPVLQDSLGKVSSELQDIEMEFLFSGVVIDPDKLLAEADREIVGQNADYVFSRKSFGDPVNLKMLDPEPVFDYSFKVLEEGQFAEDGTLPEGLVYQIQMFSTYNKAKVGQLKGLSPVFETTSSNGRYIYRVGLFNSYADVLANLNTVKRAGFRNAFIVAFDNGKELTVAKARALEAEKKKTDTLYEVRIVTGQAELDMAVADGIRQQAAGKDIARSRREDGANVYVVAPFADKETAEKLVAFVRAMGVSDAVCGAIEQK